METAGTVVHPTPHRVVALRSLGPYRIPTLTAWIAGIGLRPWTTTETSRGSSVTRLLREPPRASDSVRRGREVVLVPGVPQRDPLWTTIGASAASPGDRANAAYTMPGGGAARVVVLAPSMEEPVDLGLRGAHGPRVHVQRGTDSAPGAAGIAPVGVLTGAPAQGDGARRGERSKVTRSNDTTSDLMLRGSRGPAVRRLQEHLRSLGLDVSSSGVFDFHTEGAVRTFQRYARIRVDGIVGPQTRRALAVALQHGNF